MHFHVVLENDDPYTRMVNDKNGRTVLTAGSGSYVLDSNFITDRADVHVLIGRYSALTYNIVFVFDENISTYTENNVFGAEMKTNSVHQIIIGSDVRIEANVIIMGGIRIGDGAIVCAGSVIMEDVPSFAIAAGNPAKIIGYRFEEETIVALQRVAWWNWPEEKIRARVHMLRGDVTTFLAHIFSEQGEASANMEVYVSEETERKLEDFYDKVAQCYEMIRRDLSGGDYEKVMRDMRDLSTALYNCNQTYTDDVLEGYLDVLSKALPPVACSHEKNERRRIVFYDGFGYDTRGLGLIYLRALRHMEADLYYIVGKSGDSNADIPTIKALLQECGAAMYVLPSGREIDIWVTAQRLCGIIDEIHPDIAFLCTMPWDIVGLSAFMRFEGLMKRYQINLTDHAFWLGTRAFDYCLEFRDFGANVSRQYRHIPMQKLLKQPYYPYIDKTIPFQGFPFEKKDGDFIIFSGGSLYKTLDREKTYYRIVDFCLSSFPQVTFWYAGTGRQEQLPDLWALERKYPGRVFISGEREDLFQILQHVDMYLNTCPQIGGLMTQYAALAGRPPFTFLRHPAEAGASSVLLTDENLGIEYTNIQSFFGELQKFIGEPHYRQEKESKFCTVKMIVTEEEFTENLKKILREDCSGYPIRSFDVDMRVQEAMYAELWAMSQQGNTTS